MSGVRVCVIEMEAMEEEEGVVACYFAVVCYTCMDSSPRSGSGSGSVGCEVASSVPAVAEKRQYSLTKAIGDRESSHAVKMENSRHPD